MKFSPRVEAILDAMSVEELVKMVSGRDVWHTHAFPHHGVPAMRVSDGPAGVRGTRFGGGPASLNVPCGTALAATWDAGLVEAIGELLGRELLTKGARVHLAPTVNIHRTPVGGRNFECMSEDPLLTGELAVAYVRGVQSNGVASCIKHYVGNDTEFERRSIDSQIDERTLREIYLLPFEKAVVEADVKSVMTAYNRINGPWAADAAFLLRDVLRGEWGFTGAVMSDWFGLNSTVEAMHAGLDLEMPGPTIHRGEKLLAAVRDGAVDADVLRERVGNVLTLVEVAGALDNPPGTEGTNDHVADVALVRDAGARSMVLVRNSTGSGSAVLPLEAGAYRRVAVIGPNAAVARVLGGGSALVTPTSLSHPLDVLRERFATAGVSVDHAIGCEIHKKLPEIDPHLVESMTFEVFARPDELEDPAAVAIHSEVPNTLRQMWFGDPARRKTGDFAFGARFTIVFTPDATGEWSFGVESIDPALVKIDGVVVVGNATASKGGSFFGSGRHEVVGSTQLVAGRKYTVTAELRHPGGQAPELTGLNFGVGRPHVEDGVGEAVALAAQCDMSILVVGTNEDWEAEGWDRTDIDLPGDQDRLVSEVARVSKRTVVVVNAGSPVAMPWIGEVDAVVVAWFPGQEMGNALADVLFGDVEPQGRLPVTFPKKLADTPAAEHHPGRNGVAKYLEGRLVGYRWYDTVGREPLFPFGFGLGYADVVIRSARAVNPYELEVDLHNASSRDGVQVVQVYAHEVDRAGLAPDEPEQRLVGFAKVNVGAGDVVNASVRLDPRAYRTWDVDARSWTMWKGEIELRVATSSRDVATRLFVTSQ